MNRTAYCPVHSQLEAFNHIIGEVKVNKDSRDSLMLQRAVHASVELDCGWIGQYVVPAGMVLGL